MGGVMDNGVIEIPPGGAAEPHYHDGFEQESVVPYDVTSRANAWNASR
jgi:hypothetical protein